MRCSKCGSELREGAKFCPRCGTQVFFSTNTNHNQKNKSNSIWIVVVGIVVAVLFLLGAILLIRSCSSISDDYSDSDDYLDDNYDPSSELTNSLELDEVIFGEWYVKSGAEEHRIILSEDGNYKLFDGGLSMIGKYLVLSKTKISIEDEERLDTLEFEYAEGLLIRYQNGVRADYVYCKINQDDGLDSGSNSVPPTSVQSSTMPTTTLPSSTTKPPVKTTRANIDYNLSHLQKAISVLNNYYEYGAPCEFSDEWVYPEAYEYLNESQAQWVGELICSECCCSIDDAKKHLGKYLKSDMYSDFDRNKYVEYRGFLYIAIGPAGTPYYEEKVSNSQVTRIAYNKISVTTTQYNSGGEFYCNSRIDFEYINGSYKIIDVTDFM